jgi:hypothetical protein
MMKHKLRSIIFLLAFALLIQNTCPLGAAGKSAVFPSCKNCPLKHSLSLPTDGQINLVTDLSSIHFPMFVFAVPKMLHTFQFEPLTSAGKVLSKSYRDALPEELLRPPRV